MTSINISTCKDNQSNQDEYYKTSSVCICKNDVLSLMFYSRLDVLHFNTWEEEKIWVHSKQENQSNQYDINQFTFISRKTFLLAISTPATHFEFKGK